LIPILIYCQKDEVLKQICIFAHLPENGLCWHFRLPVQKYVNFIWYFTGNKINKIIEIEEEYPKNPQIPLFLFNRNPYFLDGLQRSGHQPD
jgi:hypothetical protein